MAQKLGRHHYAQSVHPAQAAASSSQRIPELDLVVGEPGVDAVGRRFNRRRYDAVKTVEACKASQGRTSSSGDRRERSRATSASLASRLRSPVVHPGARDGAAPERYEVGRRL
jgi:hypothetical protein